MPEVNEELRKIVGSIRHTGSALNMSLAPARMKSEAERIVAACQRLIELLGDADE